MNKNLITITMLAAGMLLAGCGVETLGAAATAAKLEAEQAKKAQSDMKKIESQLDSAAKLSNERLREAETIGK